MAMRHLNRLTHGVDAPDLVQSASSLSSSPSTPLLSSPSTFTTNEKPPRTESRSERRQQYHKKQKKREAKERRKREAHTLQQGRGTVDGYNGRPAHSRHEYGGNPPAAPTYASSWTQSPCPGSRPMAPTSSTDYGSATAPPPLYPQYNTYWSNSAGHQTVWARPAQQYWQPQAQQYWQPQIQQYWQPHAQQYWQPQAQQYWQP
jgi:hypothetical protein